MVVRDLLSDSSFIVIKKVILYSVLFVLGLAVFLIATLPAAFVWSQWLESSIDTRRLGIQVLAFEGTVWDGKVHFRYQQLESILDWDIRFTDLISGALPLQLAWRSHAGSADALVAVAMEQVDVSMESLDLDLERLNPFFVRQRVQLAGQLSARNLDLVISPETILSASGKASWSGGMIAYPVGRNIRQPLMPAFRADLQTRDDGSIYLGIRDADAQFDVIEASLTPDGAGLAQIRRRLLDLAGEHAPHAEESDVVFKVKQPDVLSKGLPL